MPRSGRWRSPAKRSSAPPSASGPVPSAVATYCARLSRKPRRVTKIGSSPRPRATAVSASAIGLTLGLTAKSAQLLARQPPGASASKQRIQNISSLSAGPVEVDEDHVESRRRSGKKSLRGVVHYRLVQVEPAAGERDDRLVRIYQSRRAFRQVGAHKAPHRSTTDAEQQCGDRPLGH